MEGRCKVVNANFISVMKIVHQTVPQLCGDGLTVSVALLNEFVKTLGDRVKNALADLVLLRVRGNGQYVSLERKLLFFLLVLINMHFLLLISYLKVMTPARQGCCQPGLAFVIMASLSGSGRASCFRRSARSGSHCSGFSRPSAPSKLRICLSTASLETGYQKRGRSPVFLDQSLVVRQADFGAAR